MIVILRCTCHFIAGLSLDRQVFIEMGFKVNRESGIALYKKDLQELLVEHTRDFYRGKAKLWLAQDACPDYMRKAEVWGLVSSFARSFSLGVNAFWCR